MVRFKKPNEMQQYADIYLLLNYSTCFGRPSRPSSGVHKTVVAASGTGYTIWGAGFLKRPYLVMFEEAFSPDSTICTRGCNYSFMYSWRWARWTPKTCNLAVNKYLHTVASRWVSLTSNYDARNHEYILKQYFLATLIWSILRGGMYVIRSD